MLAAYCGACSLRCKLQLCNSTTYHYSVILRIAIVDHSCDSRKSDLPGLRVPERCPLARLDRSFVLPEGTLAIRPGSLARRHTRSLDSWSLPSFHVGWRMGHRILGPAQTNLGPTQCTQVGPCTASAGWDVAHEAPKRCCFAAKWLADTWWLEVAGCYRYVLYVYLFIYLRGRFALYRHCI